MQRSSLLSALLLALVSCAMPSPRLAGANARLLSPDDPALNVRAPEVFRAKFSTSQGDFVIEVHRSWAPIGVDRSNTFQYLFATSKLQARNGVRGRT